MTLAINSVNKSFGPKCVVENLNLTIPAGEVYGFLGPNGAGKTTTMRMVLDIIRPDSGNIDWKGHAVSLKLSQQFGYLPEERGLYPKMNVLEQLRFFARLRGLKKATAEKEITYWIERFELGDLVTKKASELSKGNQQKVQFILAVLHKPELLILDEPFSGLDPVNVELLKSAFRDLAAEGRTIIFSSHRMDHVEELCSALCIIAKGKLIAQGTVNSVRGLSGRKVVKISMRGSNDFLQDFPLKQLKRNAGIEGHHFDPAAGLEEVEFDLPKGIDPQEIIQQALKHGQIKRFEVDDPTLNEVFISLVGGGTHEA